MAQFDSLICLLCTYIGHLLADLPELATFESPMYGIHQVAASVTY